jgi:hypothetical protein
MSGFAWEPTTPGIVRSNAGMAAGGVSAECSANNSSREGKLAQTTVQTTRSPISEARFATVFPDRSACLFRFIPETE